MQRHFLVFLGYLAVAVTITGSVVADLGVRVPGADRTQLWSTLWVLDFVADSLQQGIWPSFSGMLNHPTGMDVDLADPVGSILAAPFVLLFGAGVGLTILIWLQIAFAGAICHGFAREFLAWRRNAETPETAWAPMLAGISFAVSPILLGEIHNGSTASASGGWPVLAVWMAWRASVHGGMGRTLIAAAMLMVSWVVHPTGGLVASLFVVSIAASGTLGVSRVSARNRWLVLALGLGMAAPMVHGFAGLGSSALAVTTDDAERSLAQVRRGPGAAEALDYVMPRIDAVDGHNPQSGFDSDFVHSHYLGWTLVGLGLWALVRRRKACGFLWAGGAMGLLLSLGPVLVHDSTAWILWGDRAIPLPYLLLEWLPGLSDMALVYRLSLAPALALSLLAAVAVEGHGRRIASLAVLAVLFELRWVTPISDLPGSTPIGISPVLYKLAEAPDGAVINHPVVTGRAYAWEQTIHGKPIAGGLDRPANASAQQLWDRMITESRRTPEGFHGAISSTARRLGIRYVIIHADPDAEPAMHDIAIRMLSRAFTPLRSPDEQGQIQVIRLW